LKLKALLVCDGLSYMRTWFPNRPFSWWCLSCLSSTQPKVDRTCVRSFLLQTVWVIHSTALSWLKRLDASVSPRRTGFYPSPHHEEFMVDKVTLTQGFSPSISVAPCQYHPTSAPYPFIHYWWYSKLAT